MNKEERNALFESIQTAPTVEELKVRFMAAAKRAMADNDAISLRMLTAYKDSRKAEINDGYGKASKN